MRDRRDGDHGHDHEPDRVQRDRAQVRAKVAQGGEEGSPVEQRGEEDQQDQLRGELDAGDSGHEAEDQPAENEQDWVRDVDDAGEHGEPRDRHEQAEDDELEVLHGERRLGQVVQATSALPRRAPDRAWRPAVDLALVPGRPWSRPVQSAGRSPRALAGSASLTVARSADPLRR